MSNPYKLRGTKQPISFGVEKLDGYIVDATEETIEGEELEVEDENNNVVAHFSGFGIRYKRTASVIPLVAASWRFVKNRRELRVYCKVGQEIPCPQGR